MNALLGAHGPLSETNRVLSQDSISASDGVASQSDLEAVQSTAEAAIPVTQKGAANGVAPLGSDSKIASMYLPDIAIGQGFSAASQSAMLALNAQAGDYCIRTDDGNHTWVLFGSNPAVLSNWVRQLTTTDAPVQSVNSQTGVVSINDSNLSTQDPTASNATTTLRSVLSHLYTAIQGATGQVTSVAGRVGDVVLTKSDVGLSNVDNTSDANKPVSTAQQAALDAKQPLDSDLTAIAALSTTSYGRSLLTQADSSALRSTAGLGNVDNTSDANKPVSTAQQAALDAKQPLDSDLTAIATLSTTSWGRALLALADETSAQTYLNLDSKYSLNSLDTQFGVYIPEFQNTGQLSTISGGSFAIASGGGLVSSSSGTQCIGHINLSQPIDSTKKFRAAFLFEWNGDTTNTMTVTLYGPGTDDHYKLGIQVPNTGTSNVMLQYGFSTNTSNACPMTSGQKYWFYLASDGTRHTYGIIPYAGSGGIATVATAVNGADVALTQLNTVTSGGVAPLGSLTRIRIDQRSATTKLLGVFVNQEKYTGGSDTRLRPPASIPITVTPTNLTGDTSAFVRLPPGYNGRGGTDVVIWGHSNGNNSLDQLQTNATDGGALGAYLVNAGYMLASVSGDSSNLNSAVTSAWGAPYGLQYYKALVDKIRADFPGVRNFYWVGLSMGCINGLSFHKRYPGNLKKLVGISGVTNLSDCYNLGGSIQTAIQTAYITHYVCIQAGTGNAVTNTSFWTPITSPGQILRSDYYASPYTVRGLYSGATAYSVNDIVYSNLTSLASIVSDDPDKSPETWKNLPMKFWYGTADSTISPTANSPQFITRVTAQGGNATGVAVSGAGHLNTTTLFDGPAVVAFLQS